MRRLGVALATFLMAALLLQGNASAWRDIEWCAEDPVFQVLGAHFRVTTTIALPASAVTEIRYDVTLPSDAQGATAVHFPQGHRLPTTVNITYSGASGDSFPVSVRVTVSSSTAASVTADLTGRSVTAQRFSGTTSDLSFSFTANAK